MLKKPFDSVSYIGLFLLLALICISCGGSPQKNITPIVTPTEIPTDMPTPTPIPVTARKTTFSTYISDDKSYQLANPSTLTLYPLRFSIPLISVSKGLNFVSDDARDEVYVIPGDMPDASFSYSNYLLYTLRDGLDEAVTSETTVSVGHYTWKRVDVKVTLSGVPNKATLFGLLYHGKPFMLEERFPAADYAILDKEIFMPMLNSFLFLK